MHFESTPCKVNEIRLRVEVVCTYPNPLPTCVSVCVGMIIEVSRTGGATICHMEEGVLRSLGVLDTLAGTLSYPTCTPTTLDTPCRAGRERHLIRPMYRKLQTIQKYKHVNIGIVRIFGHRTSFPNEPVCYLSLETVFNTFHSVLLVAEITGARLAQVDGNC